MARNRRNLRRVRISTTLAIGALASADVITGALTAATTDPLRIISANLSYSITDIPALIDDGYEFGLCHSDYTDAEVEECIEAQQTIDLGNKVAQEQGNRLVRSVGRMTGTLNIDGGSEFNDGKPMKTRLNWRMSSGDSLKIYIRNSSDTIWTTGAQIAVLGDLWVKDV